MRGLVLAMAMLLAMPAAAQNHAHHQGHAPAAESSTGTEATRAFQAANAQMHSQMEIDYTGDADVDFLRGMIPHHQGAVDMARIVLKHGTDPEVRKLAEAIIAAQEAEIAWMQTWLKEHGH